MAHGFTAVKEMFLDRYAAAFAAAGFVTLAYDHFGFGSSDGEPRQCHCRACKCRVTGTRFDWLRNQAPVDPDRIGTWGSNYSAGHVIMLAGEELQIKCDVGQIPEIGPTGPSLSEATVAALTTAIGEGRLNDAVPAVSPTADGIGVMFDDGAYDWFTRVTEERARAGATRYGSAALPSRSVPGPPGRGDAQPRGVYKAPRGTASGDDQEDHAGAAARHLDASRVPAGRDSSVPRAGRGRVRLVRAPIMDRFRAPVHAILLVSASGTRSGDPRAGRADPVLSPKPIAPARARGS